LLAGYDIEEVPISWINRTVDMGTSSFKIFNVAPNYFGALMRTIWNVWRGRRKFRIQKQVVPKQVNGIAADSLFEEELPYQADKGISKETRING
jgi:hypothetical protein